MSVVHDFSAKAVEAIDNYQLKLSSLVTNWMAVFHVLVGDQDKSMRKLTDYSGIGTFDQQAADSSVPAAAKIYTGGKAYPAPTYEKRVHVSDDELAQNPDLFMELSNKMFDRGLGTVGRLPWGMLTTAHAEPHPDSRVKGAGGGQAYLCDDFTAPVAQGNLLTLPLSGSAVNSAKTIQHTYLDKDGEPAGKDGNARYALVTHGNKRNLANDIAMRDRELVVASSIEQSTAAGIERAVTNPYATDEDDWWLIDLDDHPIYVWLPRAPIFRVAPFPGAGRWEVYSSVRSGVILAPSEAGLVMSKPA